MSDPNERSEMTQRETESTQDDTWSRVEATEAAERKAQELGVDLTNVQGTGSGGRITVSDVENTYQQSDTTARSEEATRDGEFDRQSCITLTEVNVPTDCNLDGTLTVTFKFGITAPTDGQAVLDFGDTHFAQVFDIPTGPSVHEIHHNYAPGGTYSPTLYIVAPDECKEEVDDLGISEINTSHCIPPDPCKQAACQPNAFALRADCQRPTEEAILEQYAVLTAILGSPEKGFFQLSADTITILGPPTPPATTPTEHKILVQDPNRIHFPGAFSGFPGHAPQPFACNFFAPMPPSAPVKFQFPHPQPLGLPSPLNSCQCCLDERCDPCGVHIFEQIGGRRPPQDPYCGDNRPIGNRPG